MTPIEGHGRGWIFLVAAVLSILVMLVAAQTCALGSQETSSDGLGRGQHSQHRIA